MTVNSSITPLRSLNFRARFSHSYFNFYIYWLHHWYWPFVEYTYKTWYSNTSWPQLNTVIGLFVSCFFFFAILSRYFGPLVYLFPQAFKFIWLSMCTWWRRFLKCVVRTTFDIYVFITITGSMSLLVEPEGIIRQVVGVSTLAWFISEI